jgi:hypothetical protein
MQPLLSFRLEQKPREQVRNVSIKNSYHSSFGGMEKSKIEDNTALNQWAERGRCLHFAQSTFTVSKWIWMLVSERAPVGMTKETANCVAVFRG